MKFLVFFLANLMILAVSCTSPEEIASKRVVVELDLGESKDITLANGDLVKLTLLEISEIRDSLCNAIRSINVKVRLDGEELTLGSGNYHLPVEVGKVQIDCPIVKNYYSNSDANRWGLSGDARFRLWPGKSAFMEPGTFVYPVKQSWFAGMTQCGNEPCYVDWGEDPTSPNIAYHSAHDFGGAEGKDEILSAMNGLVISAHGDTLESYTDFPGDIRPDVVWILTDQGWYIRYSHLDSTDPVIQAGKHVKMGQPIGKMGKQGYSGGWVHLHFEIKTRETASGEWGTEDSYAYLWEAYINQYKPNIIAVARPHHLTQTGQQILLDGSKSKGFKGEIVTYEWTFSDGTTAEGAIQERSYQKPGEYSEILKVSDARGNVDYDFAVIQVYNRDNPMHTIPVMQAAYYPTLDIRPGNPVTFLVRSFNTETGSEVFDFGDASPLVSVKSKAPSRQNYAEGEFAETVHSFAKPGNYIVKVERSDTSGIKATAHLHVVVRD